MTLALCIALAVLVALVAYRLVRLPAALAARPQALMDAPVLKSTGHRVFSGPLEHNEHGFITTPMVDCMSAGCPCRTFQRPTP